MRTALGGLLPANRPRKCLKPQRDRLIEAVEELNLGLPSYEEVLEALSEREMFPEDELSAFASEIPL